MWQFFKFQDNNDLFIFLDLVELVSTLDRDWHLPKSEFWSDHLCFKFKNVLCNHMIIAVLTFPAQQRYVNLEHCLIRHWLRVVKTHSPQFKILNNSKTVAFSAVLFQLPPFWLIFSGVNLTFSVSIWTWSVGFFLVILIHWFLWLYARHYTPVFV